MSTEMNSRTEHAQLADGASHGGPFKQVAEQASALAQRGLDALHQGTDGARELARSNGRRTVAYVHQEPVKSILMAAAAGAVLTLILGLAARAGRR